MHVVFVHTPIPGAAFNTSIAALSAWIRLHGHTTGLLVVPPDESPAAAVEALAAASPDVVALSYMTCRAATVAALVAAIRRALPAVRVIAGGAHPTTYPVQTLAELDVDAICVGEGEEPLRRWLEDPDTAHPGVLRRGADDVLERWWAPDPDALPDWDRALFGDLRNHGNRFEAAVGVALSRGFCPYNCAFCGVDAYRRVNRQPRAGAYRTRSVERVIAEIDRARAVVPCPDGFASWDEVLPPGTAYLRSFFTAYRHRIGLPFAAQLRVEQVTPDLVDSLVIGGCDYVVIGVECGDEGYRRDVLRKPFTNDRARQAFARLHAAGIQTFGSFMIGLPHETPGMLAATVRLARELAPTVLSWKYYTPERGTALFPLLERDHLLIDAWIDHPFGGSEPLIRLTRSTARDVDRAARALEILRGDGPRGTFEAAPDAPLTLAYRTVA